MKPHREIDRQSASDVDGGLTAMIADPARCIPIMPSLDIEESRAFYVDRLGFSSVVYEVHNYLIVRRDEMEIHFWLTDDRKLPEAAACYIRGGQVGALYEEFKSRGIEKLSDFAVRPWNMKEFHIIDPQGNLLRFGCIPEEA
jgi:catechol 2,3-dioxygenase-like lactoylglutathione lyase family enzyme